MSSLVDGLIPKETECSFKNKCQIAIGGSCRHQGIKHEVNYSCACARGFEILEKE